MKVLVVPNYARADAIEDATRLTEWLEDKGLGVRWVPDDRMSEIEQVEADDTEYVLAISLGGDGTLLRAARAVGYSGVPIVGISYGHLGFLTCAGPDNLFETVEDALSGELHTSRRATIGVSATFERADGSIFEVENMALNDMAVSHGSAGGVISFEVNVSGNHIDNLRGDGFVVSTATGSTGYALAAGGPIVTPEFTGMVCVPVAPHTIMARAFLTSPSDVVEINIDPDRDIETCIYADGVPLSLEGKLKKVTCRRGEGDVVLLDRRAQSFYGSVSRVFYGKAGAR